MEVGDKVYLYSGEGREIKELKFEYLDSPIKVYNFEVEDWHTYFVSEQDVFVHNSCGMTTKQATEAARKLGYKKTNYTSHGQPVYKKGNTYITPDVDSHSGGVWKAAGSLKDLGKKSTRWGTYDANLNRIGD